MPRAGFDLRMWYIPESTRDIPGKLLELAPGKILEVFVEGGMATADKIIAIANTYLDKMVVMAMQDIPAETSEGKEKVTFKMVKTI